MVFSMPMFYDWIPRCIRPWLYIVLAFCFQFSNGMYLGAMNQVVGQWAVMREDVQMCLYATLTGMALYFVVLFRMKFRFTNQKLLMSSALIIFLCQWLATLRLPLPLLWGLCVLWMALFLQSAWLLCYGDWLDWWHSPQFRLVCGTSIITLAVCLQRMLFHPHPFYEPAMWRYPNVVPIILLIGVVEALFSCEHVLEMVYYEEVMHYDDLTTETLAQWSLPGILGGCLVSLGWLKLMRWNVYKLIAFGLMFFSLYVGGYYVLLDSGLNIEMLRIPLMCRGFSYAVLCIAFMWCLHEMMSFEHFFQALSIFNVLHMFVGGLVGAALHSYGMKYYMADGFARCSQYIDRVRISASPADFSSVVSRLVEGVMAQSIKILFGWTLLAGLFFALLMLLWDIPMVRHQIKHIPSWPRVGMGVWRGYRRQQKLHRLRVMRREAAK